MIVTLIPTQHFRASTFRHPESYQHVLLSGLLLRDKTTRYVRHNATLQLGKKKNTGEKKTEVSLRWRPGCPFRTVNVRFAAPVRIDLGRHRRQHCCVVADRTHAQSRLCFSWFFIFYYYSTILY